MSNAIRRLVLKKDDHGKAVVFLEDEAVLAKWAGADAAGTVVWSTAEVPADNSDGDLDGHRRNVGVALHGGSVFRLTEFGPGYETPMHRTLSTDYCFVLSGELELVLDSGQTALLREGDAVIQCGTRHAWRNPGVDRCKLAVCMIEARPVVIKGKRLGRTPLINMIIASLALGLRRKRQVYPGARSVESARDSQQVVRRVVTGHDGSARAIVMIDDTLATQPTHAGGAREISMWRTSVVPPSNDSLHNGPTQQRDTDPANGSSFRVLTLEPGCSTAAANLRSIDYCVVLDGAIEIVLDRGKVISLHTGDSAVLRGVHHSWHNAKDSGVSRLLVVSIEGQASTVPGQAA
ncbi:cupin domain-containing protein [Caballeronia sp. LjRoot34]|uniref:cupin domain-containing protein n=1 Tax=Caballeronia sp. LjRoot34 TaxID=3342325 RepID=UPI003ECE0A70